MEHNKPSGSGSSPKTSTASSMTTAPANKLRVVLDTNVYFSAFSHHKGQPSRIWRKAVSRSFILLVSPDILREIAGVLREDLKWHEPEIVAQLKLIVKVAEIVSPKITLQVIVE